MKKIFVLLLFFPSYLFSSKSFVPNGENIDSSEWEVIIQNMYLTLTIPPQTSSFNTGREVSDVLSDAKTSVKIGFQKSIRHGVKELRSQVVSFPASVQGDESLSVVDLIAKGKFEAALKYDPSGINERLFHEIDEITKKIESSNKRYQEKLLALEKEKEENNIQLFNNLYSIFLATKKLQVKRDKWSILLSEVRKTLKDIDDTSKDFRLRVLEEATCFKEFRYEINRILNILDGVQEKNSRDKRITERFERIMAETKTMSLEQLESVVDEFDKVLLKIRTNK